MIGSVTLAVSEVFGPTVQGEGPSTGRSAVFLRFMDCNLACSWCDTPYTWDATRFDLDAETTYRTPAELARFVHDAAAPLVVITGGEPMLLSRRPAFLHLLERLGELPVEVEVETNGTIPPHRPVTDAARYNVSPKLGNAGMPTTRTQRHRALHAYTALAHAGRAVFKFVASHPDDLDEVAALVDTFGIPDRAVWIMPEGTTVVRLIDTARVLAAEVATRGWNLTPRLHALLWPGERNR